MEKQYYWAENLEDYNVDNFQRRQITDYLDDVSITNENPVIEVGRLNFFIGKNNSGKSRFLRTLFTSKATLDIDCPVHNNDIFKEIELWHDNNFISDMNWLNPITLKNNNRTMKNIVDEVLNNGKDFFELLNYQESIIDKEELIKHLSCPSFRYTNYKLLQEMYEFISNVINEIHNKIIGHPYQDDEDLLDFLSEYEAILDSYLEEKCMTKFYIPILRGMRPVHENNFPYRKRTEHDYFGDENHENDVITGESLFQELTEHLLGEPEQRQLIADYQKLLSQYFFDNQEITLIPKHGTDVVHIKIGNEPQFPIYQLGDGLQQAIILTYPVFLNNQDAHMFFIEEPELHMHAGMVRQLMNFYLKETKHYYFFTTHSNHLLDMADESDEVIIQKFVKQSDEQQNTSFQIYRCDRDRDLLASLGVKPSSVYLANCTIWVEGITDRLYLLKYMEKYLQELQDRQPEKYLQYRRFMLNYHYAFVEYSGGNIVHWDFSDDFADGLADKGLSAKAIVGDMLLIADGDNREKATRLFEWNEELGEQNVVVLQSKEMENTLPFDVIVEVAKARFMRMQAETKMGFEIEKLDLLDKRDYFVHKTKGIGFLLDKQIRLPETDKKKSVFADGGVGTIKDKLKFCREVIQYFDNNPDWELTAEARELCERIFQHIERCNSR